MGRTSRAAVRGALERGPPGETFYAAHPEVLDYASIAETLAGLPSRRPIRLPVPASLIRGAGHIVGALSSFGKGAAGLQRREGRRDAAGRLALRRLRTRKSLWDNHLETDFETGARLTWDWYLERGWIADRGGKIRAGEIR